MATTYIWDTGLLLVDYQLAPIKSNWILCHANSAKNNAKNSSLSFVKDKISHDTLKIQMSTKQQQIDIGLGLIRSAAELVKFTVAF